MRAGDLVEYRPFARTGAHGLGIVIRVANPGVQPNGSSQQKAEVLWAKFPGDGPQWYQVHNLLVASAIED